MAKANQKQSNGSVLNFDTQLGRVIEDAMGAIERENPKLKGVLPRDYARPSLDTATRCSANLVCESHWPDFRGAEDHVRLGGLVDIISNIDFKESAATFRDVLGRICEYCLGKFASTEGKGGGEFYTPQCVVEVLVAMLEPYKGCVFETLQTANVDCSNRRINRRRIHSVREQRWPRASTSGGMFVQSEKFVEEHGGRVGETLRSAKLNCNNRRKRWPCASTTTWKLARMNLAIRGIDANLGPRNADSFRADLHPDLKADFVPVWKDLVNPPFNMSDWGGENLRQDVRWKFGMPPVNNANYAWIQHFIHHLPPVGVAGFVMVNGNN